jgi:DNA-binding NtrC family response regulator
MVDILLISNKRSFLQGFGESLRLCSGKLMVITANTAKKAHQILKTAKMDAVVVDITMTDPEGNEPIQQQLLRHPGSPVILMSSPTRMSVEGLAVKHPERTLGSSDPDHIAEYILSLTKTDKKDSNNLETTRELS